MNCPDCGREVSASLERCTACGAILTSGASTGAFPAFSDSATQVSSGATGSFQSAATGSFSSEVTGSLPSSAVFESKTGDARPPSNSRTRSPGTDESDTDATGPLEPGQAFGSRYHIIRLLGMGGMGAVYQAWDSELGVAVAIKVVLPGSGEAEAAAEGERRFKNELLLARQVTHKNVVRIHDLGEISGIKYITMSFVEGSDLASVLKHEGRLPIGRTLGIARAVASGLAAAHAEGVVHRDLKPANIMIEANDEALIMDFGIARSTGRGVVEKLSARSAPPGALSGQARFNRTVVGTVVGTLEYMAPEQARGQAVDQRADIYSFGLIVYDMLVGRARAEKATSAIAELQARMQQAPPALKTIVPEVPDPLDNLVMRCLEPDRDKRFATTAELVAALGRLDDKGKVIPIARRLTKRGVAVAAVLVIAMVAGTYFVTRKAIEPVKAHDPVTVVIADFKNNTNDASFDRTIEPTLRRGLEDATFVSAYDRGRIRTTFGVQPADTFDETKARELALKQGLGVVVSGTIDPRSGGGYELSVKAVQTVTGDELASARSRASSKDDVLAVVTRLVTIVRRALGDETSDSAQLFAMRSVSATSLDVVHNYATAIEAQSNGKYEETRQAALKAVELDPKFGIGYQLLAVASRNLGNLDDADKYSKQALTYLDGMTERERYATRGLFYRVTGDYQQCVKEYGEMTGRFAADAIAHNQRALCLSKLRSMREAVDEMRQAVQILPKRITLRGNLAVYAAYGGDFETAQREAGDIQEPYDLATLAIAFAQLGQGQLEAAAATYQKLAAVNPRGPTWSAAGLADLALHQGRFSEAARLFEEGAAADVTAKNADRAARKLTSLAYTRLQMGANGPAIAAAEKAVATSKNIAVRFLAARIFVEAGDVNKATAVSEGFASELAAEPQAYGKIIEGMIALKKDPRRAVTILTDANTVLDTWLGHFELGRAFLEMGEFLRADSEFDRCIGRRGEALSLLLDEEPTFGYFPPVYYYQGRVREGLKSERFAESYRSYLAIRGESKEDRLLPDVRKRAGQ